MWENDLFTSQTHGNCVSLVLYIKFRKNNNNNTLHFVHYCFMLDVVNISQCFSPRLMCYSKYNLYDCLCTSRYTYIMHLLIFHHYILHLFV